MSASRRPWPALPYAAWAPTCTALHLRTQVIGKVRLALTPWVNHSWHATLQVTTRGLTSTPIPFGDRTFSLDLDLIDHALLVWTSDGERRSVPLVPQSIAAFHAAVHAALADVGVVVQINEVPNEVPTPVAFSRDTAPRPYDAAAVHRYWQVLVRVDRVLKHFRTGFLGKVSPVHLFWGALDLAVTRFSGRRAPPHPGGVPGLPDRVTREAYSHEVCSAGFWPGGAGVEDASFYTYAWPEPDGFPQARVGPVGARYDPTLREFVLPYEAVRTAPDPDAALIEFLQGTYAAAAELGAWDRAALDAPLGRPGVPRVP